MRKLLLLVLVLMLFSVPTRAAEYTAPEAPEEALGLMPVEQTTFGQDLWTVIKGGIDAFFCNHRTDFRHDLVVLQQKRARGKRKVDLSIKSDIADSAAI